MSIKTKLAEEESRNKILDKMEKERVGRELEAEKYKYHKEINKDDEDLSDCNRFTNIPDRREFTEFDEIIYGTCSDCKERVSIDKTYRIDTFAVVCRSCFNKLPKETKIYALSDGGRLINI